MGLQHRLVWSAQRNARGSAGRRRRSKCAASVAAPPLILIGLGLLCHEHAGVEQMPRAALARPFDSPTWLCMREVEGPRAAKPPLSEPRSKRSTTCSGPGGAWETAVHRNGRREGGLLQAADCVLASSLGDAEAAGRAGARVPLCLAPLSPPLGARAGDEARQTGLGIARGASRPAHRAQAAWAGGAASTAASFAQCLAGLLTQLQRCLPPACRSSCCRLTPRCADQSRVAAEQSRVAGHRERRPTCLLPVLLLSAPAGLAALPLPDHPRLMHNRLMQTFEVDAEVAAQSVTIQNTIEGACPVALENVLIGPSQKRVVGGMSCECCAAGALLALLECFFLKPWWCGQAAMCPAHGWGAHRASCPLAMVSARGAPNCPWLIRPLVSLPLQRSAAMR